MTRLCNHVDFRDTFDAIPPSKFEINALRLWQCKECRKWISLVGERRGMPYRRSLMDYCNLHYPAVCRPKITISFSRHT